MQLRQKEIEHLRTHLTRARLEPLLLLAACAVLLGASACNPTRPTPTLAPTQTPLPPTATPMPTATPEPLDLVVVYTSDTVGYTEPCG